MHCQQLFPGLRLSPAILIPPPYNLKLKFVNPPAVMAEEIGVPAAPSPRPSNFAHDDARDDIQHHRDLHDDHRMSDRASPAKASDALTSGARQADSKPVRCAKFRQQELWAWKPVWSPRVIIVMYLIVSVVFIPLGIVILVQSSNLFATSLLRYDANGCAVPNQTTVDAAPNVCTIRVDINQNVTANSFLYYGVTNFYQNARTYVSSRSDPQLRNDSNPDTSTCSPLEFPPGNDTSTALNPCGLTANSQFNDTFQLCRDPSCNSEIFLNGTNIAWRVDRETRFPGYSEDFMVWMRLSAFNIWKKLYRRIEEDLPSGTYWVKIESKFPVSGFGGKKFFFISQTSWFGGPNSPLAISYIVVGCLSLVIAIFFGVKSRVTQELDLPPETTVYLKGLVKNPLIPKDPAFSNQPATV